MEKKVSDRAARKLFRRERDGEFPEQTPESAAFGPVPFYDGFGAVFPVIPPESFPLRRPLRRGLQIGLQTETDVAAAAVQAFPDPLKEFEAAAGMDEKQGNAVRIIKIRKSFLYVPVVAYRNIRFPLCGSVGTYIAGRPQRTAAVIYAQIVPHRNLSAVYLCKGGGSFPSVPLVPEGQSADPSPETPLQ